MQAPDPDKQFRFFSQTPKAAPSKGVFATITKYGTRKGLVLRSAVLPPRLHAGPESDDSHGDFGTATIAEPKSRTKTPSLYRVILINDDYTPMDFVIHVIQKFFGKTIDEATEIMLAVHQKGAGVCGVFSYEIAETKTHQVNQYSRQNRHPLKCTMEKA